MGLFKKFKTAVSEASDATSAAGRVAKRAATATPGTLADVGKAFNPFQRTDWQGAATIARGGELSSRGVTSKPGSGGLIKSLRTGSFVKGYAHALAGTQIYPGAPTYGQVVKDVKTYRPTSLGSNARLATDVAALIPAVGKAGKAGQIASRAAVPAFAAATGLQATYTGKQYKEGKLTREDAIKTGVQLAAPFVLPKVVGGVARGASKAAGSPRVQALAKAASSERGSLSTGDYMDKVRARFKAGTSGGVSRSANEASAVDKLSKAMIKSNKQIAADRALGKTETTILVGATAGKGGRTGLSVSTIANGAQDLPVNSAIPKTLYGLDWANTMDRRISGGHSGVLRGFYEKIKTAVSDETGAAKLPGGKKQTAAQAVASRAFPKPKVGGKAAALEASAATVTKKQIAADVQPPPVDKKGGFTVSRDKEGFLLVGNATSSHRIGDINSGAKTLEGFTPAIAKSEGFRNALKEVGSGRAKTLTFRPSKADAIQTAAHVGPLGNQSSSLAAEPSAASRLSEAAPPKPKAAEVVAPAATSGVPKPKVSGEAAASMAKTAKRTKAVIPGPLKTRKMTAAEQASFSSEAATTAAVQAGEKPLSTNPHPLPAGVTDFNALSNDQISKLLTGKSVKPRGVSPKSPAAKAAGTPVPTPSAEAVAARALPKPKVGGGGKVAAPKAAAPKAPVVATPEGGQQFKNVRHEINATIAAGGSKRGAWSEVARKWNVSRQRVGQIVKEEQSRAGATGHPNETAVPAATVASRALPKPKAKVAAPKVENATPAEPAAATPAAAGTPKAKAPKASKAATPESAPAAENPTGAKPAGNKLLGAATWPVRTAWKHKKTTVAAGLATGGVASMIMQRGSPENTTTSPASAEDRGWVANLPDGLRQDVAALFEVKEKKGQAGLDALVKGLKDYRADTAAQKTETLKAGRGYTGNVKSRTKGLRSTSLYRQQEARKSFNSQVLAASGDLLDEISKRQAELLRSKVRAAYKG